MKEGIDFFEVVIQQKVGGWCGKKRNNRGVNKAKGVQFFRNKWHEKTLGESNKAAIEIKSTWVNKKISQNI